MDLEGIARSGRINRLLGAETPSAGKISLTTVSLSRSEEIDVVEEVEDEVVFLNQSLTLQGVKAGGVVLIEPP